jgi:hypothetical protein
MKQRLEPVSDPVVDMVVVCIEEPATQVHVGRIHRLQQTARGLELDLLFADQFLEAADLIWHHYFYRRHDAPRASGLFTWPAVMTLTFDLAERSLPSRPGWVVHLVL